MVNNVNATDRSSVIMTVTFFLSIAHSRSLVSFNSTVSQLLFYLYPDRVYYSGD